MTFGSQKALLTFPDQEDSNKFINKIVPITDTPQRIDEILAESGLTTERDTLTKIYLLRTGITKTFLFEEILLNPSIEIFLEDGDRIRVEKLTYKPSKVFVMGSGVAPKIFNISPAVRETLADALFTENGALASTSAKDPIYTF